MTESLRAPVIQFDLNNQSQLVPKKLKVSVKNLSLYPKSLEELISLLHQAFATDEVDIDYIYTIMSNYKGSIKEWSKFFKFQPNKYTRNLVDAGNGKFNLMILCWAESQGSSIHSHTNSHCIMKCIQGTLVENRYAWPENPTENQEEPMNFLGQTELHEGEAAYISDSLGLHRVENPSHTETAASLHLYIPPYDYCDTFDERTGRKNPATVTFYSIGGQLTNNE